MSDLVQQYMAHVSTAQGWMEYVLGSELPKLAVFEAGLTSGVSLCLLGKKCAPELTTFWEDIYDANEEQFKRSGLAEGHGENLKLFSTFLERIGMPKCFCLSQEDLNNKMQLVCSVHALSYFLKAKAIVDKTVQDFAHRAIAAAEVQRVSKACAVVMDNTTVAVPSFDVLEDRVQEELQYTSVGLSQDSLSDSDSSCNLSSTVAMVTTNSPSHSLFDDPIYDGCNAKETGQMRTQDTLHSFPYGTVLEHMVAELPCQQDGVTAKVYENPLPRPEPSLREGALYVIHAALNNNDEDALLSALGDPNAGLPNTHRSGEGGRLYLSALLKEKAKRAPRGILCVYRGLRKEECEQFLDTLAPGAFFVREGKKEKKARFVFSFRNQTTIKHWKIQMEHGKYYWSEDRSFVTLSEWVAHFTESLNEGVGYQVHPGCPPQLQIMDWEKVPRLVDIAESENALTYEQIVDVIMSVNANLLRQRKSSADVRRRSMAYFYWTKGMLVHVSRKTAEQLLKEYGSPGTFIVRPSSEKDNFAITFRTETEIIHWKVVPVDGKLTIHPRPYKYDTLQEVIMSFAETITEKTGLLMQMPPLPEKLKSELCANGRKETSPLKRLVSSEQLQSQNESDVNDLLDPHNIRSWSTMDVVQWLREVQLEDFSQCFSDNAVDGECLLSLDHAQLRDDLGILPLGRRHKIIKEIKKLSFVTVQV